MRQRGDPTRSAGKTKLARLRLDRGYSQLDIELATGIGVRTLQRLEAGEITNPPLMYLVNCAVALECSIEELVEDEWLQFVERDYYDYHWVGPDPRGKTARLCKGR